MRRFGRAPGGVQLLIALVLALGLWLVANGIYQVVRKPSELFFPVSGTLNKLPAETWRAYAPIFRRHATATITPEFLAALAQVEAAGNPVVRTYWRWSWRPAPFEVYRPASSAVGMYQMTDGTFAEARHYCIHDHQVVESGPWDKWRGCWFNRFYLRVVPSHAVELTAAWLDVQVGRILARHRGAATLAERQRLAAVIHLCGAGAAEAYARRGFRFAPGERCGDHDPRIYVARVAGMAALFRRLAGEDGSD